MIKDRITEYFAAHREEMLGRLAALCRIPSVDGEPEEGKPYGAEVDRALRLAEEMFREEGFPTERAPGGEYVLASFGEGERTVGIFAHADIVPAGEGWTVTEPFEPCEHQGLLVARGVEDNKAGIIAALYLLKAVRELALPVDARLLVFVGGNEETGMRDVMTFKEEHALPDVSFVPDNSPPLSLGEKGRAEGWLVSPPVLHTLLDFSGGTAYNVVLDRAAATLVDTDGAYAAL
ncbi:MAG: M20/M25/M40 family metallo-hydrolase, partial [Clostridia bacterium]|nr:M20/M25/M40 family metallo-hydrolase [Clostridia bacterium]